MKVAAIVINWNGLADTRRCVRSLLDASGSPRVVVVDNGSTDGSGDMLRAEQPAARHIRLEKNLGFCGGANAGAEAAIAEGADALLFLNNDAWVDPNFLAPLTAELERDPKIGATGSLVLFGDDPTKIWCLGGRIRFRENVSELLGFGAPRDSAPKEPLDCDYLPGCAILVRTPLFRAVGGFDPEYFAYMEDVDFGLRLRGAGARMRAVPASVVYHLPSSSTGGGYSRARKYANAVNSVRFLRRHGTPLRWVAFWVFDVIGLSFAWVRELLRRGGDPGAVCAKGRGILDGLRGAHVSAETFARFRAEGAP